MLATKISCDACGEPIVGENGYPINDYIVVGKRDILMDHQDSMFLVSMKPKLDREYHFHNIQCLANWKKIERKEN